MNMNMLLTKMKAKLLWLGEKLKKYWYLVLFAATALYALAFAKNKDALIEGMMRERDAMLASHNTRIAEIQAGVEAERIRREEIEKSYTALLRDIETSKEAKAQEILAANKEQVKDIIARNRNNPEAMAEAVNKLFGIMIVQTPAAKPSDTFPANPY